MKIRIDVERTRLTATLDDNAASSTEKISNLPKKLSTDDAPAGVDPSVGSNESTHARRRSIALERCA